MRTRPLYDILALLGRIGVGIVFLAHGWQKIQVGITATSQSFDDLQVPAPTAAAIYATFTELLGGLALIVGLGLPVAGLLLFVDMAGAFVFVHAAHGIFLVDKGKPTNGFELVLVLGVASLLFAAGAGGRLTLDHRLFPRREPDHPRAVHPDPLEPPSRDPYATTPYAMDDTEQPSPSERTATEAGVPEHGTSKRRLLGRLAAGRAKAKGHTGEQNATEHGAGELSATEHGASEHNAPEHGTGKHSATEHGADEAAKPGASGRDTAAGSIAEHGASERGVDQIAGESGVSGAGGEAAAPPGSAGEPPSAAPGKPPAKGRGKGRGKAPAAPSAETPRLAADIIGDTARDVFVAGRRQQPDETEKP